VRGVPFAAFVCIRRFPPRVGRLPVKSTVTAGGTELASDALAASVPHSTCGSYAVLPLTRCRLTGRLVRDKKREQYELVATSFHYPRCTKRNWNNRSQVSIPELGIVLETAPDKIKRDDAVDLALAAISDNQLEQDERRQMQG
jgi:hypothetical protein